MREQLPASEFLDIGRLAQLFRNCTQSYKFLFFRSILDAVEKGDAQPSNESLLAGMIVGAWWPVALSRLNIGNSGGKDKLETLISEIGDVERGRLDRDEVLLKAREHLRQERNGGALRYVRKHLLSPWNNGGLPLYHLHPECIRIHPAWMDYFSTNLGIVRGWADHAWLDWVQSRNSNVPVTMAKLSPPGIRRALTRERRFFMRGIERAGLRCVYTGLELAPPVHIDHFLPRSFVGHDRIWNLLPTTSFVNMSKGAHLPHSGLVRELANFHSLIVPLAVAADEDAEIIEQYGLDLRLSPEQLQDPASIVSAYDSIVPSMMAIAERMGFTPNWRPNSELAPATSAPQ